ncbi:MAG: DNA gyrase inhibitor YacG [Rhodovibrio sp.]|nr:DNA gyrase inhibitor YacG [Rhodovibrio sp.]
MTENDDQDRAAGGSGRSGARGRTCPMCGKPTAERTQPFCSKRCQQLDLARWLDGSYRVPTQEPADPGDLPREDEE